MSRRRVANRTFTGCWGCRTRKVKCDETKPECLACGRIGVLCTGYAPRYVWLENEPPEDQAPKQGGRRMLRCESTWAGRQILPPDLLDLLIMQCDSADAKTREEVHLGCHPPSHNPFSVFSTAKCSMPQPLQELAATTVPVVQVSRALQGFPDSTSQEQMLFHHYVSHVAVIMMPYEHPRNPWKLHYPAIALCRASSDQNSLHHAILAQAAFNISHLRGHDNAMIAAGSKHYDAAIQQLLPSIQREGRDFSALLASIMTLLFVEIYSGQSRKWRHHLQGAWALFQQHISSEPWKVTDFVCVSLQSLNIIKTIGGTSEVDYGGSESLPHSIGDNNSIFPISSTPEFGFTIGATRSVLECISKINHFQKKDDCSSEIGEILEEVLSQLNNSLRRVECVQSPGSEQAEASCPSESAPEPRSLDTKFQETAFIHATYIYLYRTLLDVPPHAVRSYVSKTFDNVSEFYGNGGGNFSIWPAFIAAVEAYTDEDMTKAREWLNWATSFGLGNRELVRRVVEEVWKERENISRTLGVPRGTVPIDWRKTMHEMDCDVLLV